MPLTLLPPPGPHRIKKAIYMLPVLIVLLSSAAIPVRCM